MRLTWIMVSAVFGLFAGFGLGFWARTLLLAREKMMEATRIRSRKQEAEEEAKSILREGDIQARTAVVKAREAFESSIKEQRDEIKHERDALNQRESKLSQREDNLDRKAEVLDRKQEVMDRKLADLETVQAAVKKQTEENAQTKLVLDARLQRLAGMTREDARKDLFDHAREDIQKDLATYLLREKERAEKTASKTAQKILLVAMQRYSGSHIGESMSRTFPLPSEDTKGRIIGREGRNIRSIEDVTGCSILLDVMPGAVVISSSDPIRREMCALTLEKLLVSGRIQPQRIEETYAEVRENIKQRFLSCGQQAAANLNLNIDSDEILSALGRLSFRQSYSQNVLLHSQEVAAYAGMIASEMGLDGELARRVGLLHDIGKALDQTAQGPHAIIGGDFLRKNGEAEEVVDGVAGHHGEVANQTIYAVLASIADTISCARPGARLESIDRYVDRIEKLEKLALEFPTVQRAYAYQSGRDLRILVDADKTTDQQALLLAREVSVKISQETHLPGQVRVTVIREKRCIEYAH